MSQDEHVPPHIRRKKRRVPSDDSDDDADSQPARRPPSPKRPRTASSHDDEDADIDIEADGPWSPPQHQSDGGEFVPQRASTSAADTKPARRRRPITKPKRFEDAYDAGALDDDEEDVKPPKPKARAPKAKRVEGPPRKKKRSTTWSDDGDEDDDFERDALPTDDEDPAEERERGGKRRPSGAKDKPPVRKPSAAGAGKAKGKVKVKEENDRAPVMMKDERRAPALAAIKTEDADSAKTIFSKVLPPSTPAPSTPDVKPALPLPPKRKLPTIKKNKPPVDGAPAAAAPPPGSKALARPGKPLPASTPAKPLPSMRPADPLSAARGQRKPGDLDLNNPSLYQELMKSVSGGSTPRTGANRKEKEEQRRKELHRMRDEAKVKRLAQFTHTFDLQAQSERVAAFEEGLRARHSHAVFPNFLGAAFMDGFNRRKREREREEGQWDGQDAQGQSQSQGYAGSQGPNQSQGHTAHSQGWGNGYDVRPREDSWQQRADWVR